MEAVEAVEAVEAAATAVVVTVAMAARWRIEGGSERRREKEREECFLLVV